MKSLQSTLQIPSKILPNALQTYSNKNPKICSNYLPNTFQSKPSNSLFFVLTRFHDSRPGNLTTGLKLFVESDVEFELQEKCVKWQHFIHFHEVLLAAVVVVVVAAVVVPLHIAFCILHITYYILHTTCYILHTTYYTLHTTYYILQDATPVEKTAKRAENANLVLETGRGRSTTTPVERTL